MSAPLLLRRLLEQPHRGGDENLVLVLDAGLDDLPPEVPTRRGPFRVRRPATELELRYELWRAGGQPLVAFLEEDLARRLPADLLLRSRNQRVQVLTLTEVLSAVLGAEVVAPAQPHLEQLAMAHLDELRGLSQRTFPSAVDARLLRELLLEVCGELRVLRAPAAELLAAWVRTPPAWSEELRQLVVEVLPAYHGTGGRLLAWAIGEPRRLEELVIHGALLSVEAPELPPDAWGPLWEDPLELGRETLREVLGRLIPAALRELGEAAAPLLREAETRGRKLLLPALLETSEVLPLAFEARAHRLVVRAARAEVLGPEAIASLRACQAARGPQLRAVEALARLTRWLAEPAAESDDVLTQVLHYQQHGAFADLAARQLRRELAATRHYQSEARQVLDRYLARRDAENLRFARTLAADYEKALHASGLTPLHRVTGRLLGRSAGPEERFFLAVVDGCSYPVFLELLADLARAEDGGLGLEPDERGAACGLAALAPLPSMTSHARGALFLGQLPNDPLIAETRFRSADEPVDDKARFDANRSLAEGGRVLFLKGDLTDGGEALLKALEDPAMRVVAAVFNAVDDQIASANTGVQAPVRPADVTGLVPALRSALDHGRKVVVASDHGHTPFFHKSLRCGSGTSRFATLEAGEEAPAGFQEIDLGALGGPPARRAFAWRVGAYRGKQQAGFHGGCGLEELVVPVARIVADGLPADEPVWWRGVWAAEPAVEVPVAPPAPVVVAAPAEPPGPRQRNFLEPAGEIDLVRLPPELVGRLTADEKAVLVLLHQTGAARVSELAARLGRPPVRLPGLLSKLGRTLKRDGVVRFRREPLPDGESLYRYLPPEV